MHALDLDPIDGIVSNLGSGLGSGLGAGRDTVIATLQAGRDRLTDVDVADAARSAVDVSRSAFESARDAIPAGWPGHARRQTRSRWPLVALVLTGVAIVSLVLMAPVFRRWTASSKAAAEPASRPDPAVTPDVQGVDRGIAAADATGE